MKIKPIGREAAARFIRDHHRHLRPPTGWLFGVGLYSDDGELLAVGCAGRPCRALQDGVTCEITRIATTGTPNACSMLYGALRRAAAALGYQRVYTYTRADEHGASVRSAGFVLDASNVGGGEWSRPSRPRGPAEDPTPKHRYVWPASARRTA